MGVHGGPGGRCPRGESPPGPPGVESQGARKTRHRPWVGTAPWRTRSTAPPSRSSRPRLFPAGRHWRPPSPAGKGLRTEWRPPLLGSPNSARRWAPTGAEGWPAAPGSPFSAHLGFKRRKGAARARKREKIATGLPKPTRWPLREGPWRPIPGEREGPRAGSRRCPP